MVYKYIYVIGRLTVQYRDENRKTKQIRGKPFSGFPLLFLILHYCFYPFWYPRHTDHLRKYSHLLTNTGKREREHF